MRKLTGGLLCCLLLAGLVAGCGGGDDDEATNRSSAAVAEPGDGTADDKSAGGGDDREGSEKVPGRPVSADKSSTQGGGGDGREGDDDPAGRRVSPDAVDSDGNGVPEGFEVAKGGDDSVQTYGEEADSSVEDEVVTAMRDFFSAMVEADYQALCDGIATVNREQFENFLKEKSGGQPCAALLPQIYDPEPEEVRAALEGQVYQVRIEGENAFVLFTPRGGSSSYFVMIRENSGWKGNNLAPGTPFDPRG